MAVKQQFNNFQDMLDQSELPVLVDFYAPWCGPCQMMAKILEEVNQRMNQKLRVVKINTDNYPTIASQYGIEALPTLVLFKNGERVERIEGVIRAEPLIARLNPFL